jgi:hypothetical protein
MKRMTIVATTLLIPCLAFAEQGNGSFELRLPPSMQQCIDMMCSGAHRPPAPQPSVAKPEPPKPPKKKGPSLVQIFNKRITLIETRITQIRSTTEGLLAKNGRNADYEAEMSRLRAELEILRRRLTETSAMLAENASWDARGVAALGKRIDNLKESLRGLDSSNIKFGPAVGSLAFKSSDGTAYTAASFGADLQLKLSWKWDLRLGVALLVSGGERNFGTAVRAGLDYNFSRLLFVNFGLNGAWAGMNSRLHSSNAFAAVDVGFGLKWKILRVSANAMVGPEFDKDSSPSFAAGAMGTVGLLLP